MVKVAICKHPCMLRAQRNRVRNRPTGVAAPDVRSDHIDSYEQRANVKIHVDRGKKLLLVLCDPFTGNWQR